MRPTPYFSTQKHVENGVIAVVRTQTTIQLYPQQVSVQSLRDKVGRDRESVSIDVFDLYSSRHVPHYPSEDEAINSALNFIIDQLTEIGVEIVA
jgi:hypothetical protein